MTQQNNATTNWVIQDANGQPQMFKLVQSSGKSVGSIVTSLSGQPVKLFKSPVSGQDTTQTFTTTSQQSQIIKTISGSKVVRKAIPFGTVAQAIQKGPDGQMIKKSIMLTPAQMQNLKLLNTSGTPIAQKIQIQPAVSTANQSNTIKTIVSPQQNNVKTFQISPPILDHTGIRKRQEATIDSDYTPDTKKRKTEKLGKGLRHFSMKVCEKVKNKGITSYNEVADELVAEFTSVSAAAAAAAAASLAEQYDQKNIRRRVYDALNVLMAMNIISKEKKEIKWLGLPSNSVQECMQLEKEKQKKIQRIREKTKQLQELIMNQISFKNLVCRNREMEMKNGPPAPNSFIQLPFIVVNTNRKTVIDCSISHDKKEYLFHFNNEFEIQDDLEILKQIGMLMGIDKGECTPENLEKIKTFIPKSLQQYVIQLANGETDRIDEILQTKAKRGSAGPSGGSNSGIFSNNHVDDDEDYEDMMGVHGSGSGQLIDEDNSRQSSGLDQLSPNAVDYSEDEGEDSDLSSDDLNI